MPKCHLCGKPREPYTSCPCWMTDEEKQRIEDQAAYERARAAAMDEFRASIQNKHAEAEATNEQSIKLNNTELAALGFLQMYEELRAAVAELAAKYETLTGGKKR